MKEEIFQKLREIGIPESELEKIFEAISQEVLDILFEDLADKSTDEELTVIETRIRESKSPEHFQTILSEIATTVYGNDSSTEIKNIYLDLIDGLKKNVEDAKALLEKANSGDPTAQTLLEEAKKSDTFQDMFGNKE